MAEVVKMPKMSDTMTDGVLAKWHKKVGDTVKSGDLVAEVETDKATMDFESFQEGTLLYIGPKEGESVPVDGIIAILGKEGEDYKSLLAGSGLGSDNGSKNGSDSGSKNGSDKGSVEGSAKDSASAPASSNGEISSQKALLNAGNSETSTGKAGLNSEASTGNASPNTEAKGVNESSADSSSRLKVSPLARKMAEDKGIDLGNVKGSAENGRIVKKDIESFQPGSENSEVSNSSKNQGQSSASSLAGKGSSASVAASSDFEEIAVSQMRKTIARRLAESKFTAPHFYLTMSIRMDKAMELRTKLNEVAPVKISFNDLVLKAVAASLKLNPKVNSSWLGDKIRYNHFVNIGVAVAVDEGLLVPVIRNADSKSLSQISAEVKEYAQKAKDKKLQPSDWEGSTFTISNLGMFGIDEFTAIINPPDACILAVGGIQQVPVVEAGQVIAGNVMKLTLSCDHRVVDGAIGSAFLQTLKGMLEDPFRILV